MYNLFMNKINTEHLVLMYTHIIRNNYIIFYVFLVGYN